MGYACPVCEAPQADSEHLANHLAFTAMLHGDEHEAFLEKHVDGWEERTPGELAAELIHHADEVEYDEVFEDTTGAGGMGRGEETVGGGIQPGRSDVDPVASSAESLDEETLEIETQRAIEEARKLFERGGGDNDEGEGEDASGGDDGVVDDDHL